MPEKYKLVYAAILALVVTDTIRSRIKVIRHARMYLAAMKAYEETERDQTALISYLFDVLNKHEIEADEFDLIALNYYSDQ